MRDMNKDHEDLSPPLNAKLNYDESTIIGQGWVHGLYLKYCHKANLTPFPYTETNAPVFLKYIVSKQVYTSGTLTVLLCTYQRSQRRNNLTCVLCKKKRNCVLYEVMLLFQIIVFCSSLCCVW